MRTFPGVLGLSEKQDADLRTFVNFIYQHKETLEALTPRRDIYGEAISLIPEWFFNWGLREDTPCSRKELMQWTGIWVYPIERDSFGWLIGGVSVIGTKIELEFS